MFGRGSKKPKKQLVSCPFCFGEFEDVTLHLNDCVANQGGPARRQNAGNLQVAASAPTVTMARSGAASGASGAWSVSKRPSRPASTRNTNRAEIAGETWERVLDPAGSNEYYYWNRSTNQTQWTPPEGWPSDEEPAESAPEVVKADSPAASPSVKRVSDLSLSGSASAPSLADTVSPRSKRKSYGSLRKKKKAEINFEITRDDTATPPHEGTESAASSTEAPFGTGTFTSDGTSSVEDGGSYAGSPDEDQRTRVVKELLATEIYYIDCLQVLMDSYYEPLMKMARLNRNTDAADVDITIEQVDQMFGNISHLIPINVNLRDALQERVDNWSDTAVIGDVFLRMAPFLKMYDKYGLNYHDATTLLDAFMKDENFQAIVDSCYEKTDLKIRMGALLITPVQRIPRYVLLLRELKKNTPEGHPELKLLDEAIPVIQEVADYLNRNITEYENQRKFMALSEQGAAELVQPHRTLMHEGLLMDMRKKAKVHIWLFNDLVVHVSEAKAKNKSNLVLPRHQWVMHLVWIEASKRPDSFILTGPNRTYEIKTPSPEECSKWIQLIEKALSKHFERLEKWQDPTLVKEQEAKMRLQDPKRFGTYTFPAGGTYCGWWKSGKMDGEGEFEYMGSSYKGSFRANERHGKGTMVYVTGDEYTGEWSSGLPRVLKYFNGDVYDGQWKDGKKSGKGDLKMKRGCVYSGDWKDDVPDGMGEFKACDGMSYTGNWSHGKRSHYGIWEDPQSTRKYEGEWENGLRHGKGRMEYGNGVYYDGLFREGQRNGKGKFHDPEEGTYEGMWVADRKEGKGVMTYTDGSTYDGSWKADLYHGVGTVKLEYGMIAVYSGEWHLGYRHGKGVLEMRNGDKFDGHFKDGVMNGNGTLLYANKMRLEGKWVNGRPWGKCTLSRSATKKQKDKKEFLYTGVCKHGVIYSQDRARPSANITHSPVLDVTGCM